jgi:hypothetical protein
MRPRHAVLALLLGVGTVLLAAEPAGAHGVAGIQPSNFTTIVTGVSPAVRGLHVRVDDLGNKLELDNGTGVDITVLGYQGEPYLRVGPAGVYENLRSPAVYLNRTRTGNVPVPRSANPALAPEWRRVEGGTRARWHDHRAHWLAASYPPEVQAHPGSRHLVQRWTVGLVRDGARITVHGVVEWIPGPSPWPWLAITVLLGALVVAFALTRLARPAMAVALAAMIVGEAAYVIGIWGGTTVGGGTKLAAVAYVLGGMAVGGLALAWVVRRGVSSAAPLLLLAGLFLGLAGGLANITTLFRSQLPTSLPHGWERFEVAMVLGVGAGVAVVGALRLRVTPKRVRRPVAARRPVPAATGAASAGTPEG